jgi:3-oxoacyl-[acyl-carrier protein] reductase
MMQWAGKAAIITGGGTGVGRATALDLAKQGCSLLINYSRSKDDAEKTCGEIEALGAKAIAVQADVADDDACRKMVDTAVQEFGRIDLLVNNAGTTKFVLAADLEKVRDEDWLRIYAVNVIGPFHCARAVKEPMLASGGGQIINVASVAGIAGKGSSIPYAASKAALINLTVALARTLAPKIRVNAVAPGFIGTGILDTIPTKLLDAIVQHTPLGRMGRPDEVGEAYVWLASDAASFVHGAVITVDGGLVLGT